MLFVNDIVLIDETKNEVNSKLEKYKEKRKSLRQYATFAVKGC